MRWLSSCLCLTMKCWSWVADFQCCCLVWLLIQNPSDNRGLWYTIYCISAWWTLLWTRPFWRLWTMFSQFIFVQECARFQKKTQLASRRSCVVAGGGWRVESEDIIWIKNQKTKTKKQNRQHQQPRSQPLYASSNCERRLEAKTKAAPRSPLIHMIDRYDYLIIWKGQWLFRWGKCTLKAATVILFLFNNSSLMGCAGAFQAASFQRVFENKVRVKAAVFPSMQI